MYDAALFKWKVARPRDSDWFRECPGPGKKVMASVRGVVTHRWFEYAVCKYTIFGDQCLGSMLS